MKYRKKPVVIEAFKYDGDLTNNKGEYYIPDWAKNAFETGGIYYDTLNNKPGELFIQTLEGNHHVSVGDYIIQGVQGELYPCKPTIFEQTYELESVKEVNSCLNRYLITHNICGKAEKDIIAVYKSIEDVISFFEYDKNAFNVLQTESGEEKAILGENIVSISKIKKDLPHTLTINIDDVIGKTPEEVVSVLEKLLIQEDKYGAR